VTAHSLRILSPQTSSLSQPMGKIIRMTDSPLASALLITLFLPAALPSAVHGEDRFYEIPKHAGHQEVIDAAQAWHVTDDGLKHLRSYLLRGEIDIYMQNKVRRLTLDGTQITDKGLRHFAGRDGLLHLETLSLAETQVTDAGLPVLSGLKNLRRIRFGRTYVFREGVSGTRVTQQGLQSLQQALPDCQIQHQQVPLELSVRQREQFQLWSAAAVPRLNQNGDIEALFIRPGTKLTQQHRDSLPQLKSLSELHAGGTFSATETASLTSMVSLRQICLRDCRLDDTALQPLARLANLSVVDLAGCQVSDRGLKTLQTLTHLSALNVQRTAVRTSGLQRFRKALPETELVFDPWRVVGLPYVHLKVNDRFELAAVNLPGRNLRRKELTRRLSQLLEHPSLEQLNLRHLDLTDSDLKLVSQMKNLRVLDLGNTQITPAGVPHLAQLEQLESLNLWKTKLSGNGGLTALEKLPHLESLELDETQIDDTALSALTRMPKLNYTELWHTDVTRAGVASLQQQRPRLTIRSNPRR